MGITVGNTGNPDSKAVKFNRQLVQEYQTEIGFGEWMVVSRKKTMNRNPGWRTDIPYLGKGNSHDDGNHPGSAKAQIANSFSYRQVKGKGPLGQAQSKSQLVQKNGPPSGSRFNPLAGSASNSNAIPSDQAQQAPLPGPKLPESRKGTPVYAQPTPVLIPTIKKTQAQLQRWPSTLDYLPTIPIFFN